MEELEEYYHAALVSFAGFSQGDWLDWIAGTMNNNPRDPIIVFPRAEEINTLFWVYNNLSENKKPLYQEALRRYCISVVKYLEIIPPLQDNYPIIFTLIHFINDTRPFVCRQEIERLIRDRAFEKCVYLDVNLNYFLIKAYIPIEDSLTKPLKEFLERKLAVNKDPYFLYVYFHYQYKYSSLVHAFQKLHEIAQDINDKVASEITIALKEIVVMAKSFAQVNEGLRLFLANPDAPIAVEIDKLVRIYEGVMEYVNGRPDYFFFEELRESVTLAADIRRAILEQCSRMSAAELLPESGAIAHYADLNPAIQIYGSDINLVNLVFNKN